MNEAQLQTLRCMRDDFLSLLNNKETPPLIQLAAYHRTVSGATDALIRLIGEAQPKPKEKKKP